MIRRIPALLLAAALGCRNDGGDGAPARPFLMGFSPWPYDATLEAKDWVYARIHAEGDIVSHPLEEGVPWPDMADGRGFSGSFLAELEDRRNRRVPGKKTLIQINPLNVSRTGLAAFRGATPNEPLPSPWDGYALDSPQVKSAFLTYARQMVEFFEPDCLLIGVEVNLLIRNNPSLWPAYVDLHRHVYSGLKALFPELPVAVSFFSVPFFPEASPADDLAAQRAGLADLTPWLDFVAFSVHPFMSAFLADTFPDDSFDRLFAETARPIAISESSYPAQVWSNAAGTTWYGSPEKQDAFLAKMLSAADRRRARFVIWFCIRDYDALWNGVLGRSEEALVWRDTGLYDEAGAERLALRSWRSYRLRPWAP
jgi:hypothetical protein